MSCGKVENMVDFENKPTYNISDFQKLTELLCSPDGCPWDREQTHKSIKHNFLEEANEAAEAIDSDDTESLIEELGDVLMQVLFHADIGKRAGLFDLDKICDVACKKTIRRHPHVFGDIKVENGASSLVIWNDIKRKEKIAKSQGKNPEEMTFDEMKNFFWQTKLEE
jgi:tetrapyrrole methylase family protein/MazG family protein